MADIVSRETRSRMMAGIRGKNTKPEILIRKALSARGFRYRLHGRKLPGHPDLVFARRKAVIFVNGCFWHRHECTLFKWPGTRREFWQTKLARNAEKDAEVLADLAERGWRVLVVWECALRGRTRLGEGEAISAIADWLNSEQPLGEIRGTHA
jgi:DNA mismatch endonuclease (patch repair protein)